MQAGPFPWIGLAVADITVAPGESGGMCWCPCVHAVFPSSPCVGGVRAHVARQEACVSAPAGSIPVACHFSSCVCMRMHTRLFPFSSLFGGVAVVAALDSSWNLSMDCVSCGRGWVLGGGFEHAFGA
jgi:hypothetical protein